MAFRYRQGCRHPFKQELTFDGRWAWATRITAVCRPVIAPGGFQFHAERDRGESLPQTALQKIILYCRIAVFLFTLSDAGFCVDTLYNIRMRIRIATRFGLRLLIGLGILLIMGGALWFVRQRASQSARRSPSHASAISVPDAAFQVEGYPIEHLPETVTRMKYVATFEMDGMGMDLLPTSAGFLTREGDDYILHDWSDGHSRWRVSVPTEIGGWGQPHSGWDEINNSSFALSDDGRYFAASVVENDGVHIRRWHDGKIDGECLVLASTGKPPKPGYYALTIGNNSRIFLAYAYDTANTAPGHLLALDGHRIIAKGMLPGSARMLPGGEMTIDSARNVLYAVNVNNGRIRFTSIARKIPFTLIQCPGNYLLALDGAVYTPSGRVLPPSPAHSVDENDGWRLSGLGYQSKVWHTDQMVFSKGGTRHEVFSLANRTHWSFTSMPGMDGGTASADGRYVLLHGKGDITDGPRDNQKPPLASGTDAVWLYERPGTLRAALRYAAERVVPFEGADDPRRVGESCNNWLLSPDGRSVVLKYQYMGIGGTAVLYRW